MMKIVDMDSNPSAVYTPINGGTMSIIRTAMSAVEVSNAYKIMHEDNPDLPLPVIVIEPGKDGVGMWLDAFPNVKRLLIAFNIESEQQDSVVNNVCELSLDQLLDLISKVGMKKLSAVELEKLKELSKNK
jgi:hypothetical protein